MCLCLHEHHVVTYQLTLLPGLSRCVVPFKKGDYPILLKTSVYLYVILVLCIYCKYILEDIFLHRIFFKELPLKFMEKSEKSCTKQIHIHYFTKFYVTLDQLNPNFSMCHCHLGQGLVTMQCPVAIPTGVHWLG